MTVKAAVMTEYEKIAIILSVIAIALPFITSGFKKFFIRAKLKHYHDNRAVLFINRSGSYIYIKSVFEALKKPVSITSLQLLIKRCKDDVERKYVWSSFRSPVNYEFVGNNAAASETAHPFRIEADQIACAFTEYTLEKGSFYQDFQPMFEDLCKAASDLNLVALKYEDASEVYGVTDAFTTAHEMLEKELFWQVGDYTATIIAKYGNNEARFNLQFSVSYENYEGLIHNIDETIYTPLKQRYRLPTSMKLVEVNLKDVS